MPRLKWRGIFYLTLGMAVKPLLEVTASIDNLINRLGETAMQRNMNDLETENEGMYESDIHTEIGMRNLLTKALYETGEEERIEAFESAGLLPMDKGIVVKLTNGSNFYITIVKSR